MSTPHGDLDCEHAVVATGYDLVPVIPDWPGREDFAGELIHASAYRNAEPYRGRDVLVVGPGCSGTEIAYYLAVGGAGRVRLAVRSQPQLILRVSRGIPADATGILATWAPAGIMDRLARVFRKLDIGDLAAYGLEVPEEGVVTWFRRRGLAPTIIDTEVVDAIKDRRFEIVGAVERFERARVILADGSAIEPEVVIAATGYERGLETLVGHLGVLGGDGRPSYVPPLTHPEAPGLHFVGYVPALGGNLREVRLQARRLVRALKRG